MKQLLTTGMGKEMQSIRRENYVRVLIIKNYSTKLNRFLLEYRLFFGGFEGIL